MSLVRFLPAWLHAVADYAVAVSLIAVALIVGGSDKAIATGVVIGAVVLVVSMLTRYPLGVIKVLPFTVHSAGDYLAVILLAAAPFALSFHSSDPGLTVFYLVVALAVLLVSLITNYQYGPTAKKAEGGDADRRLSAPTRARGPIAPAYPAVSGADREAWRTEAFATTAQYAGPRPASASGARSLREILAERAAGQ